jgi:hypothetical protein
MPRPAVTEIETFKPEEIGWVGLLLPFVLVIAAVIVFGNHSATQIAASFILLVPPIAIFALRRQSHRSRVAS